MKTISCRKCSQENPQNATYCCHCGCDINPYAHSFIKKHKCFLIITVLLFVFIILPIWSIVSLIHTASLDSANTLDKNIIIKGGKDKIALLDLNGIIVDQDASNSLLSDNTISERTVFKTLQKIEADSSVKGLILKINSPGGSAAASEEIYQDILQYKRHTGNKVTAYFSDIAASGGYYVAMSANYIVANPSNITGSIGVILSTLNFQEIANKYGVKNIVYKSGPYKDILNEFREPSAKESEIMQSLIQDTYRSFTKTVQEGRNLSEKKVLELADGRPYSAQQAKENRLIDSLGTFQDTIKISGQLSRVKNPTVVEYGQNSFLETLLGTVSPKVHVDLSTEFSQFFKPKLGAQLLYLYNP